MTRDDGDDADIDVPAEGPTPMELLLDGAAAPVEVAADRVLELQALPEGRDPKSLGLIPAVGIGRVALPVPAGMPLHNVPALAVSLEPRGGSPTGPVLYFGGVQRLY